MSPLILNEYILYRARHLESGGTPEEGERVIAEKTRFHDETTVKDIGVNKPQPHRWQSIAALPKKNFEGYIREHKEGAEGNYDCWGIENLQGNSSQSETPSRRVGKSSPRCDCAGSCYKMNRK